MSFVLQTTFCFVALLAMKLLDAGIEAIETVSPFVVARYACLNHEIGHRQPCEQHLQQAIALPAAQCGCSEKVGVGARGY